MPLEKHVARDISYASSAKTRGGRAVIRIVENLTGRPRLIKRARDYDLEVASGKDFWKVMVERYDLTLNILRGALGNLPKEGPLIVVSNHPFGILDGLMLGHILSEARGDFRILAHRVFKKAEDIDRIILPISFDETKEAVKLNIETRKAALRYLAQGGCIGVFPGGTVSTAKSRKSMPMDPTWRNFTAKMISKSDAKVVPIFFDGVNGKLFQSFSRKNYTMRMALLINEFRKRVGGKVDVVIGEPIDPEKLNQYKADPTGMMRFLREETYRLSPKPIDPKAQGFEFEESYR